jgi:hypothetical protein
MTLIDDNKPTFESKEPTLTFEKAVVALESDSDESDDEELGPKLPLDTANTAKLMATLQLDDSKERSKETLVAIFQNLLNNNISIRESYAKLQLKYRKAQRDADKEERKRHYAALYMNNKVVDAEEATVKEKARVLFYQKTTAAMTSVAVVVFGMWLY